MIDTAAEAVEMVAQIRAAVNASDLSDKDLVVVSNDGRDVQRAQSLAAGAIIVYPTPGLEWPNKRVTHLVWTIAVVASVQDTVDASGALGSAQRAQLLVSIVRDALRLSMGDRAVPTDFKTSQSDPNLTIPGYAITYTKESYS